DFMPADPAGPAASAAALLDRGLPDACRGLRVETGYTSWLGIPDLATRSLAVGGAVRSVRAAFGVSVTGPSDAGWDAAGAGAGVAAGLVASRPAARVWVEGLERPLRGAVGVRVGLAGFDLAARVEGHPVLGETVTLSLARCFGAAPP